ncbi:RNA-directed DNA polymerase, eukaryota [Tanacetum coccineum]
MGIGTRIEEVDAATTTMGCLIFTTPFVHLGVKVGGAMSKIKFWDDVVAKVSSSLSKRKLKTLSIGGRLTLIKSVLTSIPLYHMSIFKVPSGVLKLLESIRRNFFNGVDGSKIKMAWIRLNKVLAFKKYDDIIREVNVLHTKGINLLDLIRKKVGNGLNTLFWEDPWLDDLALKHKFSRLYALDNCKQIIDVEKINHASMVDTFRRPPRRGAEEEQLEATVEFFVKFVRHLIDDLILPKEEVAARWVKVIPIKVNVFAWRVRLDKLSTRLNLYLKGIDISTIVCPLCHTRVESGSHIFFSYPMAHHLWRKLMRWWELEDIDLASYNDWLLWLNSSLLSKRLKEVL